MNENGYLKFILTVLTIAVVLFGYLIVSALDRLRESNYVLADRLASSGVSVKAVPAAAHAPVKQSVPAANREFFSPDAVPGGRMIQATEAETGNLNPLTSNEAMASSFNALCSASLAARNFAKPEEFQPLLAESWSVSPDHKVYTIKLRKGVLWQPFTDPDTGKHVAAAEVTAKDFKFFADAVKNPEVNCAPLRVYYQHLDTIEIVNDHEFKVKWKKAYYGSFASTLGMTPLPMHFYAPQGKFDGKKFNDDHKRNRMIVGCGPYIFQRWEKGGKMVFRKNPEYFGNALGIGPALETLIFELIKHPNTRFQALMGGQLDRLGLTPDQYLQRTNGKEFRSGALRKYRYLLPQFTYIGYNQKNPLFRDVKVRRALTMLVDRVRLKKEIYHDLAEIAVTPFFPGSVFAPKLAPLPYDPAEAKKLLKEAGWQDLDGDGILEKGGKKFTFTMMQISSSSIQQRMMPMLKESFASAGIDMKIRNVEWSVYVQNLNSRSYDVCCLGWSSSFDPDPYQIWHSSQIANEGSNHIGYANKELDGMIEELQECFQLPRRIELCHKIGKLLHEEQPYTFLFFPFSLTALSGRYRNVRVFPSGIPEEIMYVPKAEQKTVRATIQ